MEVTRAKRSIHQIEGQSRAIVAVNMLTTRSVLDFNVSRVASAKLLGVHLRQHLNFSHVESVVTICNERLFISTAEEARSWCVFLTSSRGHLLIMSHFFNTFNYLLSLSHSVASG